MGRRVDQENPGLEIDCDELTEVVTEYLEGRLAAPDRARFEAHVSLCPGCAAYVAQIEATIRLGAEERRQEVGALVERLLPAFRDWKRGLAEG